MTNDDVRRRRLMSAAFLLGSRRAEAKAREHLESLADRFEAVNEETLAEIRELRADLVRARMVADIVGAMAERAETRWLH